MLSFSEPSLVVMFVASTPLKKRLVEVVRVPLTEGDWLPLLLVATGESSVLTPASVLRSCVKLRVEVGTATSCSAEICREMAAVSGVVSAVASSVTVTVSSAMSPTSSLSSSVRGTDASTSTFWLRSFLKPEASYVTSYVPTGSAGIVHRPSPSLVTERVSAVPVFFAVTVAFGTAAPFASLTTPLSVPVDPDWATAPAAARIPANSVSKSNLTMIAPGRPKKDLGRSM